MIVVTGGAGFIGSAVVARLNAEGRSDILIVDNLGESAKWKNLVPLRFLEYVHKDKFLSGLSSGLYPAIQAIVHMGACSSTTEQNSDYLYENNYTYSKQLAEYCLLKKIRFIYASSAATYGNGEKGFSDDDSVSQTLSPINRYGYSKQLFDLYVLRERLGDKIAGLKFFNVYGPNEYHKGDMSSVIYKAFHQIRQNSKLKLFKSYRAEYPDGGQQRDFVYVKDCVDVIWYLLNNHKANGIFNLGTGIARTWNDLAKAVFTSLEISVNIEYIDMPESIRDSYQYYTQSSPEKLRAIGYKKAFTNLEDGIEDYVKNYLLNKERNLQG